MNYNDVNSRLKRIYASIEKQNKYGAEVLSAGKTQNNYDPSTGLGSIIFHFGDGNDADIQNQIHSVISNLANLKDCLKEKMEEQGKSPQLVEDTINKSLHLSLVIDLSNQEKHGYPTTSRRSMKDPLLANVYAGLSPSNKPDNISYHGSNGAMAHNVMIAIHAEITDSQGNHICSLDELIEGAIREWETIIQRYQIV